MIIIIIIIIIIILIMSRRRGPGGGLHSAKGGAVETGCSDLYGVIYYLAM